MYRNMFAGALLLLLVLAVGAVGILYSGAYDISASSGHSRVGQWVLENTMANSVRSRAADIQAPRSFAPAAVLAGGSEYKAMCQQCHGGPGAKRAEWAEGLVPLPPDLTKSAVEWRPNEIYWIVKHGIKMTAMPAFGEAHGEETLWSIAGFVEQLPTMAPQQYAAISDDHGEHSQSAGSDHSQHTH